MDGMYSAGARMHRSRGSAGVDKDVESLPLRVKILICKIIIILYNKINLFYPSSMIIDLHNHTSKHSICSIISPDELIKRYIQANIEAICITEHDYLWKEEEQNRLIEKYKDKIKIFFGMEVSTDIGHVLLFGSDFRESGYVTHFENFIKEIDRETTALIWAHPYRWQLPEDLIVDQDFIDKFDAIELYNGNLSNEMLAYTKNKLSEFDPKLVGGSDTHSLDMAVNYATEFKNPINTLEELVENIKYHNYKPIVL